MDGPVVLARNVKVEDEPEVLTAFERTMGARDGNPKVNELVELCFCCRAYWTSSGLRGRPEREWIEASLR